MLEDQVEQLVKLGFDVSEKGRNGERFIFRQTAPTIDEALEMLKIFTFEDGIFFWNFFHVTISDPGAYVIAYVLNQDRAVYEEGNHGWSSEYKAISLQELAELIIKNWDKDCDRGEYLNKIEIRPHYDSRRDMYFYDL